MYRRFQEVFEPFDDREDRISLANNERPVEEMLTPIIANAEGG